MGTTPGHSGKRAVKLMERMDLDSLITHRLDFTVEATEQIFKEIEEKAPLLTRVYDLVITSPEKVMQVDAIVISGHTVCGYTSNEKTDETKAARYIKEMLHNHKYEKVTVKVFHDYVAFLSRAEGMNSIAAIEKPDNRRRERRIRHLLLTTSM